MTRPEELDAGGRRLRAALAPVSADAPELRLVHRWLDSWSGIGLIVTGMSHQGFTVSLGEHGVGRWIAAFFHGRGGHEPIAAAGTAQEGRRGARCSGGVAQPDQQRNVVPTQRPWRREMTSSLRRFAQSLILCAACSALVPSSAFGQSLKEQLTGTWLLVATTRVVAGVEEPGMFGRDAIGQFMFAPDGHMCFNAMRSTRSKFASNDFQAGAPEEKTAAYDSYIGYCGRYEVNEQERSIVLHFALSTYPNWTGTSQNRFAEIVGNRLRISTPPIRSGGKEIVNAIVWERPK